jgi:hypothetical protein
MIKKAIRLEYFYKTRGSSPIQVLTDDFSSYVVKYNNYAPSSASMLFNEYMASNFLKIWDIPTPNFDLISINQNLIEIKNCSHISKDFYNRLQRIYYKSSCFGSAYINDAVDIDDLFYEYVILDI